MPSQAPPAAGDGRAARVVERRHETKPAFSSDKVSPLATSVVAVRPGIVDEVAATVARDPVVVVGMAQNPFVKKARRHLQSAGVAFTYLEYGSYCRSGRSVWPIKLWAGFPTFPMVFIDGVLIGGESEFVELEAEGKMPKSA